MTMFQPEVGQMVFGNPSSEYETPEYVTALLERLADEVWRVTHNATQHGVTPTNNEGSEYVNGTFEMRSYYWGECECGWDGQHEYDGEHDDSCYQTELRAREMTAGVHYLQPSNIRPGNGEYERKRAARDAIFDELTAKYGLPRAGCAVHCTCTFEARLQQWFEANRLGPMGHAETCRTVLPNFKCGDFEVRWYKHARRGSSMNREVTADEMAAMFDRCMKSCRESEARP